MRQLPRAPLDFRGPLSKIALFYIYFSFLLTINLKLLILHVEIKIMNKEAATKRNTLLQAIFRKCCIIMGGTGRNNKLKDKRVLTKKGQAGKETYQKKCCHGSKGPFQKHMAGQNT